MRNFLSPINFEKLLCKNENSISSIITCYEEENSFPKIVPNSIVILGVPDSRNDNNDLEEREELFIEIRKQFYSLFPNYWKNISIYDIGNLKSGKTKEDTCSGLQLMISELAASNCTVIILGNQHWQTYGQYKGHASNEKTVNGCIFDSIMDVYSEGESVSNSNFIGKMISTKPFLLFDCGILGYQTFLIEDHIKKLIEKLNFECIRKGKISHNNLLAEPVIRNSDFISIDLKVLSKLYAIEGHTWSGFSDIELCTLANFAGLSNRVKSLGIYGFNLEGLETNKTSMMVAQLIWYFIEGVKYRTLEYPQRTKSEMIKYIVAVDGKEIIFYKNKSTERFWMEISLDSKDFSTHSHLIPCSKDDYLKCCNNEIPDRWWKFYRKML